SFDERAETADARFHRADGAAASFRRGPSGRAASYGQRNERAETHLSEAGHGEERADDEHRDDGDDHDRAVDRHPADDRADADHHDDDEEAVGQRRDLVTPLHRRLAVAVAIAIAAPCFAPRAARADAEADAKDLFTKGRELRTAGNCK